MSLKIRIFPDLNDAHGSNKRQYSSPLSSQDDEATDSSENSDTTSSSGKRQPKMDPFQPECRIPLPFQLMEDYSYYAATAVYKRNERERQRVRCVNDGYERLREHLPLFEKSVEKFSTNFMIRISFS